MENPLVSIKCTVYNHEPYLRQCLDGFVMQKTNFPFEAIVHDDASTDHSADIIREYAAKYPDIIKPMYETENQWSKHDGSLERIMDEACTGKYIAICEGDDYWTDSLKLQKQTDFLDSHPNVTLCSSLYKTYEPDSNTFKHNGKTIPFKHKEGIWVYYFDLDNYWKKWVVQPVTCMYRNLDCLKHMPREKYKYFFDAIFFYYYLKLSKGIGVMLSDEMAVYRLGSGIWSTKTANNKLEFSFEQAYSIYKNEGDTRCLYQSSIVRCAHIMNEINVGNLNEVRNLYLDAIHRLTLKYDLHINYLLVKKIIKQTIKKILQIKD